MNIKDRIAPIICITGLMLMLSTAPRAETPPRTVAISPDATLYERAQTLRAINELTALGYPTRIAEQGENHDAAIFFIRNSHGLRQKNLGISITGVSSVVFVDRVTAGNYDLCGIIKHELAHSVWDLPHTASGFMAAAAGPDTRCRHSWGEVRRE